MKKKTENNVAENPNMPLGIKNYYIIIASVLLLIVGFLLLSGGGSDDPNVFNYEMFSVRRIVIAPLVMLAAFVGVGFGVMYKFKTKSE